MEKLIELENNVWEQKNRLEIIEKELKEFRAKKALDIASQILEQMITLKKMDNPKPSFEPGGVFINKKEQPKEKSEVEKFIYWYTNTPTAFTGILMPENEEEVYQKWLKSQK